MNIGIVCATEWEIKGFVRDQKMKSLDAKTFVLESPGLKTAVRISGIGPENAIAAAEYLTDQIFSGTVDALISTGFACGLKPQVKSGDVVADFGRSDKQMSEKIDRAVSKLNSAFHRGVFWCASRPLMSVKDKQAISQKSGALACEMESQSVYDFCTRRDIPFGSFRTISDTLDQNLPSAVLCLNQEGGAGLMFWSALITRPSEWPSFLRLAWSAHKAEGNLRKALGLFLKEMSL